MRPALAAATLIKEDDAVAGRVEQPTNFRIQRSAGPTVQENRRLACRIAALLPIDLLAIADVQHSAGIRLDCWVKGVAVSVLGHVRYLVA